MELETRLEQTLQMQDVPDHNGSSVNDVKAVDLDNSLDERTLFVGNLPYRMTWQNMKTFFSKFGTVVFTKAVTHYVTKKPRGYGFVEFETSDAADRAYNATDGELQCYGRTLRLSRNAMHHRRKKQSEVLKKNITPSNEKCIEKSLENDLSSSSDLLSPINKLDDYSLIHILGYLTPLERIRVERVCKRWKRCAVSASKQQKHMLVVKQFKNFCAFTEVFLHNLLKRTSQNLQSLDVSLVSAMFGNQTLYTIAEFCKNLEKLNMSGVDVNNKGMEDFTAKCTNLRWIKAVGCRGLSEKGFWHIFYKCKKLEYLDCSGNPEFTGKCLFHAEATLKTLHLNNCRQLCNEALKNLSQRSPNLEVLNINSCIQLTSDTLSTLIKSLPNLKEISLGSLKCHTGEIIRWGYRHTISRHVVQHIINPSILVKLELFNTLLMDPHLTWICARCLSLTELDISCNKLTDVSVRNISALTNLKVLSVCHLYNITNASLMDVALQGNLLKLMVQGCQGLTDDLMQAVAENCLEIEELDVAGVWCLSSRTFSMFSQAAPKRTSKTALYIYVAHDHFDEETLKRYCYSRQKSLVVIENYRPHYPLRLEWTVETEEEALQLRTQNIELEEARLRNPMFRTLDPRQGGWANHSGLEYAVELFDSIDEFDEMEDPVADEFLYNDDPLARERFGDFLL